MLRYGFSVLPKAKNQYADYSEYRQGFTMSNVINPLCLYFLPDDLDQVEIVSGACFHDGNHFFLRHRAFHEFIPRLLAAVHLA